MSKNKYDIIPTDPSDNLDSVTSMGSQAHVYRGWHYSMFHLWNDCDSLAEVCLCTPCQVSRQFNMLYNNKAEFHWGFCLFGLVMESALGSMGTVCVNTALRGDMRSRYGIEGNCVTDMLLSSCCYVCALQQQLLEMKSLGYHPGYTLCLLDRENPSVVVMQ